MYTIMKVVGVPAGALGKVHEVISSETLRTHKTVCVKDSSQGDLAGERHPPYVKIEDCKLDPKHGTYTITLKVLLRLHCKDDAYQCEYYLYLPVLRAIESVLKSISPDLIPQEEVERTIESRKGTQ